MNPSFAERIEKMNRTFELEVNAVPSLVPEAIGRIEKFYRVLFEEVGELLDVKELLVNGENVDALVALADNLADIVVYARSEAMRWGIPLEEVLDIVMDSNDSKLDVNGRPIKSIDGAKFLKGPLYWKPEPKIKELLLARIRSEPKRRATVAEVFDEWARRYDADPASFAEIFDADTGKTIADYGDRCAAYFTTIESELNAA